MKFSIKILAICAFLGISGAAIADPIPASYGDPDDVVGATDDLGFLSTGETSGDESGCKSKKSNPANEECWAEAVLDSGDTLTFDGVKNDPVSFQEFDGNLIAFALESGPGYYIIKNANFWVLMDNNDSFQWGVLNLGDLSAAEVDLLNLGDLTISHVTEFNGSVPEPGTLALLGFGLVGLGVARRRRKAS